MGDTTVNPLVSVILASYNHVNYIDDAVWSVLGQGVDDIELIVVDDNSTDGTRERLEKIKDPRLKLICLSENRRYHPRNTALSMAAGKYIAFQNSDDVWKYGKLKRQLDILENDDKLSACFTNVEIIDEIGCRALNTWANGIFTIENRSSASWLRRFFDGGNCVCLSSAVVRASKLQEAGRFNSSLIQVSDFDLWIRLAAVGEFYIIGEELTSMRVIENNNMSGPALPASRRSAIEFIECLWRYAEQPVLGRLREAFNDVLPENEDTYVGLAGGLAVYAWQLSTHHIFWANSLIAEIVKDEVNRDELVRIFGTAIIHDYIKRRGQVEIVLKHDGS